MKTPTKIFSLSFALSLLAMAFISCQSEPNVIIDQQKTIENSVADFAKDLENARNVDQDNITPYLVASSKKLLENSGLSPNELDTMLGSGDAKILQAASNIYFAEMGIAVSTGDQGSILVERPPAAAYQPKLTIINLTPCTVNLTPFMYTVIGNCGSYYYPKYAIAATPGTSTYTNGFASFPNNYWFNDSTAGTVTTAYLVNQGYTGYYRVFKYLVGTNCANTSIGYCGAPQGLSYTQMCNGCNGGGNFYTSAVSADYDDTITPPYYSNPDSINPEDQDMTLIIIQN